MNDALVTVLMPVFNACDYVDAAINSVINQNFEDWHLLIINDGSTDNTAEVLEQFKDHPQITIQTNPKNLKLIATLNSGLELITSPYIARLDADDIMRPNRLYEQTKFMEANKKVMLCGMGFYSFSEKGDYRTETLYPSSQEEIVFRHLVNISLCHGTIIIRNKITDQLIFNDDYPHAEDYELFEKISAVYKVTNLNTIGTSVRIHEESVSQVFKETQLTGKKRVQSRAWSRLNMIATRKNVLHIEALLNQQYNKIDLSYLEELLESMLNKKAIQSIPSITWNGWCCLIGRYWYHACRNRSDFRTYALSSLSKHHRITLSEKLTFRLKSFLYKS